MGHQGDDRRHLDVFHDEDSLGEPAAGDIRHIDIILNRVFIPYDVVEDDFGAIRGKTVKGSPLPLFIYATGHHFRGSLFIHIIEEYSRFTIICSVEYDLQHEVFEGE